MADHLSEQEQIELLKKIWKEYGLPVLMGVAVAMLGWISWSVWQSNEMSSREEAASLFLDMNLESQTEVTTLLPNQEKLRLEYPQSVYVAIGALKLAKVAVDRGQLGVAEKELSNVTTSGMDPYIQNLIKIRMARILLSAGSLDNAASTVQSITDCSEFLADCSEIKGDIYRSSGKKLEASNEYAAAIKHLADSPDQGRKKYIQMKNIEVSSSIDGLSGVDSKETGI
jgi:predicted negative regulator of RcsB-dependent stress response